MRQALTRLSVQATRTLEAVDALLGSQAGTTLMAINSMSGCAAGGVRPGIALALKHAVLLDQVAMMFTGGDREATTRVREDLQGDPLSSPSVAPCRSV
jgi:putative YphP/YqiW family bacilliredoxin